MVSVQSSIYSHLCAPVVIASVVVILQFVGCDANRSTELGNSASLVAEIQYVEKFEIATPTITPNKLDSDLYRKRKMWMDKGSPNYTFEASLYVGGVNAWAEPVRIVVKNNVAISITPKSNMDHVKIDGYKSVDTIDKMFDFIERGFLDGAEVKVKYDPEFGYPREWHVNYYKKGSDRYSRMVIRKFTIDD
jgi:hypothetical protein